jgi:hypothetical protein
VRSKDRLYERLLAEKDERIRLLLEERVPAPSRIATATVLPAPDAVPSEHGDGGWVSETEEAEDIIAEMGLSPIHLPEILSGLGYGDSDLG